VVACCHGMELIVSSSVAAVWFISSGHCDVGSVGVPASVRRHHRL